ncbi:hypothetical protein HWA77_13565 [Photobacterium damselae subsp. damselae]|uniref:Uncharacterized protein n=1 Tax=Photobacterium damselae subsp. damselae TaxID=85581 RepID=A0A850R131_PHODD|nr:hypothetical protein [Photobacterium damselae subsp. damselae]
MANLNNCPPITYLATVAQNVQPRKNARLDEVIVNQNIIQHPFHCYNKFTQCPVHDWAVELRFKMTDL